MHVNPLILVIPLKCIDFAHGVNEPIVWTLDEKAPFYLFFWPLIKACLSSFVLLISYTYFYFFFFILLLNMDVLPEIETDWSIVVFSLTCMQSAWDLYHIHDVL